MLVSLAKWSPYELEQWHRIYSNHDELKASHCTARMLFDILTAEISNRQKALDEQAENPIYEADEIDELLSY